MCFFCPKTEVKNQTTPDPLCVCSLREKTNPKGKRKKKKKEKKKTKTNQNKCPPPQNKTNQKRKRKRKKKKKKKKKRKKKGKVAQKKKKKGSDKKKFWPNPIPDAIFHTPEKIGLFFSHLFIFFCLRKKVLFFLFRSGVRLGCKKKNCAKQKTLFIS